MDSQPSASLFAPRAKEPNSTNFAAWGVAAAVILLALGGVLLLTHHKPAAANVILPLDPYAPNLAFSEVQMSESSSVSGMKVTFIDGKRQEHRYPDDLRDRVAGAVRERRSDAAADRTRAVEPDPDA